ncbi:MAG: UDP-N-acetylmuramoyl-tripeptide--D-alanyl-D-alanine ligase [Tannerellaceae bacterium]|nr:UDP-N-acetylmuramoyl-tripeptide--D-alanyl-D-alanine ligase [Tannerellaceae bacterium]
MTIAELYEKFLHHPKITTDSRNCPKASLFFGLKGERFDGNEYAAQALSVGASYAIIDDEKYYTGERTILVENALVALQKLARHHRKVLGIPVIAITGTNGKTTTKELVASVLSSKFNLAYTEGNLNNQIGVPLTLLKMNHEHEMAVIEMGASKPGDIKELVDVALPNYGIITNVGHAHLEGFGSFEGVVQTKGELYDYLKRTKGTVFINEDDPILKNMARGIEQVTYGTSDDVFASGSVESSDPFLTFNWKQQGKINIVETHLIGSYNLMNALAAVAIGRYFKIPSHRISRIISEYEPVNNRSQLKCTGKNELIIDAYNANPSSMKVALENFASIKQTLKAVILGDMFELGEESEALHREIVDQLKGISLDKVYLCGEIFGRVTTDFPVFGTTAELKVELEKDVLTGYTILIKGSRGMALEQLVDAL